MAITLPSIEINFKQLASTFIERSTRGIVILLIKDDTNVTFNSKVYTDLNSLIADEELYTATNYQYITDALTFAVSKVVVVRVATTDTISDALAIVPTITSTGWITYVGETADYTTITSWIKAKETAKETFKAVVFNATAPDCRHIVNFGNTNITFNDVRGQQTGEKYLPSLAGILASCNVEKGSTYFKCTNLTSVVEAADNNVAINSGKFILINDINSVPKVGLGINSLTTFDTTNPEDFAYIDIVEAMDLIVDDIRATFKNNFLGQYKNNIDNQILFISAVNTYLTELSKSNILDSNYRNYTDIDVIAQRDALTSIKPEAVAWDDIKVKNTSFRRMVFLMGDIKILASMENLKFNITM